MTTKSIREYMEQLDEISRRDFLKGAGAAAVAGSVGYWQGTLSVYEQHTAEALGYIEQFLESHLPDNIKTDPIFEYKLLRIYRFYSKGLDPNIRTSKYYKLGKELAKTHLSALKYEYLETEKGKQQAIGLLSDRIFQLEKNAGYIRKNVDETSPEAIDKITQLTRK